MKLWTSIVTGLSFLGSTAALADQPQEACPPYETVGAGPDLILIPGLGSSPATWDGIKDALSERYTVHLVHVAGFASRAPNGPPDTIIARAAQEIVDHLDCNKIESALYAGHSLGGFLGLKLAKDHPDRIKRLVIVDALPFFPLLFSPQATADTAAAQAEGFKMQILRQSAEEFAQTQQVGVRSLVKNSEYHGTIADWSIASDRATFASAIHSLMTTDLRPALKDVSTPTTIIAASNAFAPRSRIESLYQSAYASLETADIRIVEDSYHFIMFDQPEIFETELLRALEEPAD